MSRIVIFGIDGASLKLIERWKDSLPNLRRIMENGVYGELESTVPPMTCPAWPSMFTGKNPGELGMYYFVSFEFGKEQRSRVFNSTDWHNYALWKILNEYGLKVGVFNVPITFPPHGIDSFMVCGTGTPVSARKSYTYPSELAKTLDSLVGGYIVTPPVVLTIHGKEKEYWKVLSTALDKKIKAAEYLMNNFPWELFICVFFATDSVQHYFWHHMDPKHPRHNKNSRYKNVIKDTYRRIDDAIGKLAPKDANILIVSDHGFGPLYGTFSLNKWLEVNGYLAFNKKARINNAAAGMRKIRDMLVLGVNPKIVHMVAKAMPQGIVKRLSTLQEEQDRLIAMINSVDWDRTRAYNLDITGGIFVTAKGREYERIRGEIIDKLSKMVCPKTGEPLGLRLFKAEEIYHGRYLDLAPDIAMVADRYYPSGIRGEELWQDPFYSGIHTLQGTFMACGPDIRSAGARLGNLKIYDITPTILHLFGLPVHHDMDGRVLTEVFKPGSEPATRPVVCEQISEREKIKSRVSRLKHLGKI